MPPACPVRSALPACEAAPCADESLRWTDVLLLFLFCVICHGPAVLAGRSLSGHEAVVPQCVREMLADGDWLIPKCGGFAWLERPPLSHWFMALVVKSVGSDSDRAMRLSAALAGAATVCLVGWLASLLLGRRLGLLSALILATMQEFVRYAVDPEADIFLCTVVTAALALFVRLELGQPTQDAEPATFFGRRPWQVLVFFLLLGATNWIKGLIFGTLMVLVPTTVFALCRFKRDGLRRYVWFWGWLAFSVVWLAWPVAVWLRQPDAIDLWHSDYFGRLNGGYVGEPGYYYALALSWVLLPWTIPALLGFCLVRARAWRQAASVERWLCIWALSVPLVFSIPDGKHHHYLLSALAPWAMLAALGTRSGWRWLSARPPWFAPACGLTLGVGLDLALYWLRERVKGPAALVVLALLLIPFLGGLVGWILSRRDHRLALGSTFLLLAACHGVNSLHQAWYRCGYREENHFLAACQELVPEGSPLYINHDRHCLENFRLLFYIRARQPVLLLNASFLRDDRIEQETIYVLARQRDIPELAAYGDVGRLRTSASYRDWADDPRVLLRLRFRGDLKRCSCQTHVTAMQAAYRAPGPYLK